MHTGTILRPTTVRLSSNDHPDMGVLISQLLDLEIMCFNVALNPLGIQRLNTSTVYKVSTAEFLILT